MSALHVLILNELTSIKMSRSLYCLSASLKQFYRCVILFHSIQKNLVLVPLGGEVSFEKLKLNIVNRSLEFVFNYYSYYYFHT